MSARTAVVTGGASGIGLGVARALARDGANVALADIRASELEAARAELCALGIVARGYRVDVSDRTAMDRFAQSVECDFGGVDILINNAGVAYPGIPVADAPAGDIDWIFGVNVFGVINGIRAFVPVMRRGNGGGHVVNTSSLAGLVVMRGWHQGIYAATKMAVVALSEGLRDDLAGDGIGVSVLCPAAVKTDLYRSSASANVRPGRFGDSVERAAPAERQAMLQRGLDADAVGTLVVAAIAARTFYIVTHPEMYDVVAARHAEIARAFGR